MSDIERLRTVVEAEQRNDSLASGQPYDDDATVNWTNEVRPVIVLALLDVAEAARDARSLVFRGKQLTATPGHRDEGQRWLGDALNKLDAALARLEGTS